MESLNLHRQVRVVLKRLDPSLTCELTEIPRHAVEQSREKSKVAASATSLIFPPTPNAKKGHKCPVCSCTSPSQKAALNHLKSHMKKSKIKCPVPSCKRAKTKSRVNRHMQQHIERPFQCSDSHCKIKFKTADLLQYHILVKHSKMDKPYKCALCPQSYKRPPGLCYHIQTHTGEFGYTCSVCQKEFKLLYQPKEHFKTTHENRRFKCSLCPKEYKCKRALAQHISTKHMPATETKKPAGSQRKLCFKFCIDLGAHIRTHTKERPYACKLCPYSSAQAVGLASHMNLVHQKLVVGKCSTCAKKFKSTSNRKAHERVRSGEKPYACSLCDKTFTFSQNLKAHLRAHRGQNIFECKICSKMFASHPDMVAHGNKDHGIEKPLKCKFCPKRYNIESKLKVHELSQS